MASIHKQTRDGEITWQARWREPGGRQRKQTFARKIDAERFLTIMESDKLRGTYIDPAAGKITFRTYATAWLDRQTFDESTRVATELRLRLHVTPILGDLEVRSIKPSTIQQWIKTLAHLSASYRRVIYANVSAVLSAAVDDELIARNPFKAGSVRPPSLVSRKVTPWTVDQLQAVHDELPERYRILATLGAGLGLRQGEIFALAVEDIDFLRGRVEVRRQVKVLPDNKTMFALPKGRKTRTVPLPQIVRDELAAHLRAFPAVAVTLPWQTRDGESATARLVLTSRERRAMNRNFFNSGIWKPALSKAGVELSRENGCHALRHLYASMLLDAGESIRAVSEYLGHADAGFTLRTYTHLMPASEERTKSSIDRALRGNVNTDQEETR
jgi:integrase